ADGQPADPDNLRTEGGPSTFAGVRQRFLIGASLPLPVKFSISPLFFVSTGTPYNITTGIDSNGDGFTTERPALAAADSPARCRGGDRVYEAGFGCFNLRPAPEIATIKRNYAVGPDTVNLSLRLARTWSFGSRGESGVANGGPIGLGGARGGG